MHPALEWIWRPCFWSSSSCSSTCRWQWCRPGLGRTTFATFCWCWWPHRLWWRHASFATLLWCCHTSRMSTTTSPISCRYHRSCTLHLHLLHLFRQSRASSCRRLCCLHKRFCCSCLRRHRPCCSHLRRRLCCNCLWFHSHRSRTWHNPGNRPRINWGFPTLPLALVPLQEVLHMLCPEVLIPPLRRSSRRSSRRVHVNYSYYELLGGCEIEPKTLLFFQTNLNCKRLNSEIWTLLFFKTTEFRLFEVYWFSIDFTSSIWTISFTTSAKQQLKQH